MLIAVLGLCLGSFAVGLMAGRFCAFLEYRKYGKQYFFLTDEERDGE